MFSATTDHGLRNGPFPTPPSTLTLLRELPAIIVVGYLSWTNWRRSGAQNFAGGRPKMHGTQIREKDKSILFASQPRSTNEFLGECCSSTYSSKCCIRSRSGEPGDLLPGLLEFGMIPWSVVASCTIMKLSISGPPSLDDAALPSKHVGWALSSV